MAQRSRESSGFFHVPRARARYKHVANLLPGLTVARMAIALTDEQPQHQQLSSTQFQRNTRKRPDKTCGRKRPCLDDFDVVPASDADPAVTAQLTATICVQQLEASNVVIDDPAPESVADIQTNIYHQCDLRSPPLRKSKKVASTTGLAATSALDGTTLCLSALNECQLHMFALFASYWTGRFVHRCG